MIQAAARAGTDAALYAAAIARWDNEGGASLGASHTHATPESHKVVKFEQTACRAAPCVSRGRLGDG